MTASIEIIESAPVNSIQDLGRPDHVALGVSPGGAMDRFAARLANALVGNAEDAACVEVASFPFRLRFHARLNVALTGADSEARLNERALPPWWTFPVQPGDVLTLQTPVRGRFTYVAASGGIDVPPILGSRSTDMKSAFGGLAGRGLQPGDRLSVGAEAGEHEARTLPRSPGPSAGRRAGAGCGAGTGEEFGVCSPYPLLPSPSDTRLRVLAAADFETLTPEASAAFTRSAWKVTSAFSRTGAKLDGPPLSLRVSREVLSYGVMPGLIQLPPNGSPIVQLAEANTCGGYPRIGTLIGPDLRLLAQTCTGATVRFELVDHETAVAAVIEERAALAALRNTLTRARAA